MKIIPYVIGEVQSFKYLRSYVQKNGNLFKEEVKHMIQWKKRQMFHMIRYSNDLNFQ